MADPKQHNPVDTHQVGLDRGWGTLGPKRGRGHTDTHVMTGEDANTLLAGRLKVEINRCVPHLLSNNMRPPACVKLKRA